MEFLRLVFFANCNFGFLFLVCRPGTNDYLNQTGQAVMPALPANPGAVANIPTGTTAFDERRLVREFEGQQQSWTTYQEVLAWFLASIQETCGVYIHTLRHHVTGYSNIAPHRFFAHLYATYARMTDALLAENLLHLEAAWDPFTEQIESLFSRQERSQQIAETDDPISNRTLIRITKQILQATGQFSDAIRAWDGRMPAHQTWNHFKQFFQDAFTAFLEGPAFNARQAGYHANPQANGAAQNTNDPPFGAYCWSHGFSFDPDHTSANCRTPAPGHQTTATLCNMMGGCARLVRRREDQPIFRRPQRNNRNNNGNNNGNNNNRNNNTNGNNNNEQGE